jgi:hypothetical protein
MRASIGQVVHFIQSGEGGKGGQDMTCLAAIVTDSDQKTTADLFVIDQGGKTGLKNGVAGDRGSEGAETWHAADQCPYGK